MVLTIFSFPYPILIFYFLKNLQNYFTLKISKTPMGKVLLHVKFLLTLMKYLILFKSFTQNFEKLCCLKIYFYYKYTLLSGDVWEHIRSKKTNLKDFCVFKLFSWQLISVSVSGIDT